MALGPTAIRDFNHAKRGRHSLARVEVRLAVLELGHLVVELMNQLLVYDLVLFLVLHLRLDFFLDPLGPESIKPGVSCHLSSLFYNFLTFLQLNF